MSELKFRAWDKERGGFDDQVYIATTGEVYHSIYDEGPTSDYLIEQCTGLRDKNGREIYVGDILRLPEDEDGEPELYAEVVYHNGRCAVKRGKYHGQLEEYVGSWDIVGNIHEIEKLMEEK